MPVSILQFKFFFVSQDFFAGASLCSGAWRFQISLPHQSGEGSQHTLPKNGRRQAERGAGGTNTRPHPSTLLLYGSGTSAGRARYWDVCAKSLRGLKSCSVS
ncbi:hypothetical protein I7I50_10392 [Histoplasma capsulatum G186AR]|uniref:Uncharacterized protein n=1 Tax=Ajellomyces capsulatus TaxID=5037 RepID=A0A8H7Z3R8_AJECA|nr:hypothetical protein I7I52_01631 [Histoplasma capsulatum]QSS69191.1 hypothetical protein I7I50_10392 [Histoplasma capsulatum G186AR]